MRLEAPQLRTVLTCIAILFLPFAVFYWFHPFWGHLSISNDYDLYSIQQQLELQYSLLHGTFPLYTPGFAMGRPSAALTLGQLYHPITHLAAHMPGYWQGLALDWNTLFRLLSLGVCQAALFVLFRRLHITALPAFILSFLAVYNLRMLDMFRYGAALENYTGFLLLCIALGFYFIKPTRVIGPLSVIFTTFLLVCGGHPQMMYLGLISAAIWTLFLPHYMPLLAGNGHSFELRPLQFYGRTMLMVTIGIMLSSAYLLPLYFDFAKDNVIRGSSGYMWSINYSDTLGGALESFFNPLKSDVHGSFGSSPLILLAALIPLMSLSGRRVPVTIMALWLAVLVLFLMSIGDSTPLYYLFWKFMPFADAFRVPGRLSMAIPWLLVLLLAWLWRCRMQELSVVSTSIEWWRRPLVLPSAVALVSFLVYSASPLSSLPPSTQFVPQEINGYPRWIDNAVICLGIATLLLVCIFTCCTVRLRQWRIYPVFGGMLAVLIVTQLILELRYGTWVDVKRPMMTLALMDKHKHKHFAYVGNAGYAMELPAIREQMDRAFLERTMAKYYRDWVYAASHDEAYDLLAKYRRDDLAVIERMQSEKTGNQLTGRKSEKHNIANHVNDTVQLAYSSVNRVEFNVNAGQSGYLVYSQPYSKGWRARVDGVTAEVLRAEGYLPAVFVPAGGHVVEFRYESPVVNIGMAISLSALAGIGVYCALLLRERRWRRVGIFIAIVIPGLCYYLWADSLYGGESIGTNFTWTSRQFMNQYNLAYRKPTQMSSITAYGQRPYDHYSGNGVDGSLGTVFMTDISAEPQWWEVDLGNEYPLASLVIYRLYANKMLPLRVSGSQNGRDYFPVAEYKHNLSKQPIQIPLNGVRARYIRIVSLDIKAPMAFREVAVFPVMQDAVGK